MAVEKDRQLCAKLPAASMRDGGQAHALSCNKKPVVQCTAAPISTQCAVVSNDSSSDVTVVWQIYAQFIAAETLPSAVKCACISGNKVL